MRVLILGGTGMLGHKLFLQLYEAGMDVYTTVRSDLGLADWFPEIEACRFIHNVEAQQIESIYKAIDSIHPNLVINCIGIIKQLPESKVSILTITVNALLPHLVAQYCEEKNVRFIHISTDCVFDGRLGDYRETDQTEAIDLYGRTKLLGEVVDRSNTLTLRTSLIGHELKNHVSLIDWFLGQQNTVHGYTNAIYSGFPTIEFARIIQTYILPNPQLRGLYHISAKPISKFDLLRKVAEQYGKIIDIVAFDAFKDNKSLDSSLFQAEVGYKPPAWDLLIEQMHKDYIRTIGTGRYGVESDDYRRDKARNH